MSYEFIDYLVNGAWILGLINHKQLSMSYTNKLIIRQIEHLLLDK